MTTAGAARFAALRDEMHRRNFAPESADARRVGAEVELLAHDAATGRPLPLIGGGRNLVGLLRAHARRAGWRETPWYGSVPAFEVPGEATITFEPGGQLEVSTIPCTTVSGLLSLLRSVVLPLRTALWEEGVRIECVGIDPRNRVEDIPLQLPVERYQRMTEYFDSIGPAGARMMRQTAAIQLSLDRGTMPAARWRLLNDLAPYVVALFANSPRYQGVDTGHRSFRAHCWRTLDPTRTGMSVESDDPAAAYTRFAIGARDMMRRGPTGDFRPFAEWPDEDDGGARWATHLTTLFPEVRPRGHYEVRSCDALDPAWYAAPAIFLTGLAYDAHSAREAALLASDSRALLRLAGEQGLGDAAIARTARDLFQLAIAGARRLGAGYVALADCEIAEEYYRTYTVQDRSPADDARPSAPTGGGVSAAARPV